MDHINVDDVSPTSSSSQEDNEPVPCGSRIGTSDVQINEGSQTCSSCGTRMSEYFCFKCKHFTGVDKNPFHCDKCGMCRIHRDRAFHCDVCNVCLDKRLEGKHKCRPKHTGHKSKGEKRGSVTYSTDRENKENQGQEGDMLEDQCELQTERIVDAVPGDGDGVDSDNESNPESESTCSEEDLSAMSNDAVLRLKATAAPRSREQIAHLENTVQELKKENQTLEAVLKIAISRGDIPDLPGMNAVCDDSSTRLSMPAYRHFNTGVATNVPLEPSLVDVVQGIDAGFLARHSQDPHLCESPQANVENTSLREAEPNVASSSEDPVSRQWIRNPCLVPSENDCVCCENDGGQASSVCGTIIPERCRPDSVHVCYECSEVSSSEDPVFRQWIRNPCLVPSENDCVCCENDGSQACTERCRPDSDHDVCCECLEDVVNGLQFLPCPHHIHMACLIDMIRNGALNCPLCGRPFLRRD